MQQFSVIAYFSILCTVMIITQDFIAFVSIALNANVTIFFCCSFNTFFYFKKKIYVSIASMEPITLRTHQVAKLIHFDSIAHANVGCAKLKIHMNTLNV